MTAAHATLARLVSSEWSTDQERDSLLAHLIGKPLSPADALKLAIHGDDEVAAAGQRFFAARTNVRAVRELIGKLPEARPAIRQRLTETLHATSGEFVRAVIDELLRSREPAERRLGWDTAIELIDPLRYFYLRKAVVAAPPAMQLKALGMMLEQRKSEELRPLLLKLCDAHDDRLASRALQALSEVRGDDVLELMLARFATGDQRARAIASDYLKREAKAAPELVRKAMLQGLTHRDRAVRRAASQVLFASGPAEQVVPEALKFGSGLLGWLRNRVLKGLSEGGEPILTATLGLLDHRDASTRFYALTLAETFESPELVEPFCRLLRDDDWWIRVTVCDSLANLEDQRAVPELIAVLDDDEIRWAAIDALGRLGTPAALQALVEKLKDPREEVRLEVLQGLSQIRDERLMPVFSHCRSTDGSLAVRRRASELISQLISDLGLDAEHPDELVAERSFERPLEQRLYEARRLGASDLNLAVGEPPLMRLDGELKSMSDKPLGRKETKEQILSILTPERQEAMLQAGELDFAHEIEGVGRYRGNAFLQRKGWSASFRVIPERASTMERLGMPEPLLDLDSYHHGVVVFCGPTGSGKSSSLSAIVNRINDRKAVHIITLEDPIELVHRSKLALVNQRQIGTHTENYANGLRASLREDPDVIVLGELRQPKTIRLALEAAETGHLVLTTLHTSTVVQAIDRLTTAFSPEEQDQARTALSETLKYVVCQRLVPKAKPPGRIGVFEVLKITPSIGHLIRKGETHQILGMMQLGSEIGNRTLDQALMKKVEDRSIRPEDAWYLATKRALFEPLCDPAWLADRGVTPT